MADVCVTRREIKYLLDRCTAEILKARLRALLPTDQSGKGDGYLVRSLYFDTAFNQDYLDKIDGLEIRKKIRLRIYSPDDKTAKLELKKKQGVDQRKYSAAIAKEDAQLMAEGQYVKLLDKYESPFVQSLLRKMELDVYAPRTIVEFRRLAFMHETNDTRITFDTGLCATEANFDLFSPRLALYPVRYPVILEVKYHRFLLSHIKNILQLANMTPVSTSKYCLGRQVSYF